MSLTMILDDNKLSPKSELHRKSSKNFLPTLRIVTHMRGGKETRKNVPIKLGLDGLMSAIPSMMMAADESCRVLLCKRELDQRARKEQSPAQI